MWPAIVQSGQKALERFIRPHTAADVSFTHPRFPRPGVRKELEIDGQQVLMFWYRNQIYCIQARSPAEGAYSEGFIKAKFTQVNKPTGNVCTGQWVGSH